ncbi:MAG: hypothetical protein KY464_05340 [Gemmatimonadetes bacterium]|nr:hypothetical protein [Gemmatimonadota bacterium]
MSTLASHAPAGPRAVDPAELRVSRLRPVRGPNFWRLAPVIACDVALGSLEDVTSAELDGFTDRLLGHLPSLHEHPCSRGESGGFVERLREGTHLPHILEHVALEQFEAVIAGDDDAADGDEPRDLPRRRSPRTSARGARTGSHWRRSGRTPRRAPSSRSS